MYNSGPQKGPFYVEVYPIKQGQGDNPNKSSDWERKFGTVLIERPKEE
jgi:hypothetical protein